VADRRGDVRHDQAYRQEVQHLTFLDCFDM
jgi:hypothetical protein